MDAKVFVNGQLASSTEMAWLVAAQVTLHYHFCCRGNIAVIIIIASLSLFILQHRRHCLLSLLPSLPTLSIPNVIIILLTRDHFRYQYQPDYNLVDIDNENNDINIVRQP